MKKLVLAIVLLGLCSTKLWAIKDRYSNVLNPVVTGQVLVWDQGIEAGWPGGVPSPTNILNIGGWQQANFLINRIDNGVLLKIRPGQQEYPDGATASVDLTINYWSYDPSQTGTNSFLLTTKNVTLSVVFDSDQGSNTVYRDIDYFSTSGLFNDPPLMGNPNPASYYDITVNNVVNPSNMNIELESFIEVDRKYRFDLSTIPAFNAPSLNTTTNKLEISWSNPNHPPYTSTPQRGAEAYDFEWMHINDYDLQSGTSMPNLSNLAISEANFAKNCSRVRLTNNGSSTIGYSLPLIYERGYLVFRVRAVGYDLLQSGLPIEGNWDLTLSSTPLALSSIATTNKYQITQDHDKDLNWQANSVFAEEGKRAVRIAYRDGTDRQRQEVSELRADGQEYTVIGEQIYDDQGRPAINIMPVPSTQKPIKFYPGFNQNGSGKAYNKADFDLGSVTGCTTTMSSPLDNSTGASYYYSVNNNASNTSFISPIHADHIPDAKGYPMIQTEYVKDKTGKIKRQSSVGPDHQLGSGHEKKYFYTTPSQNELDRFFGSEVGYAGHYEMQSDLDENGQLTINYINADGNIIATRVGGPTPNNLKEFVSTNNPEHGTKWDYLINTSLNGSGLRTGTNTGNLGDYTKGRIDFTKSVLVTKDEIQEMYYSVSAPPYSVVCEQTPSITNCYDCVFDIDIKFTNECGESKFRELTSSEKVFGSTTSATAPCVTKNFSIGNENGVGSNTPWNSVDALNVAVNLPIDQYTISKTLILNEEKLNEHLQNYLADASCFRTEASFRQTPDLDGCGMTCTECKAAVDAHDASKSGSAAPFFNADELEYLRRRCDMICNGQTSSGNENSLSFGDVKCNGAWVAMVTDMAPGGQYGKVVEGGEVVAGAAVKLGTKLVPSKFPLSIYNSSNQLPKKSIHYGSGGNFNRRPHWKLPYNENLSGPEQTRYLDEFGNIAKVYVPNTYSGSVRGTNPSTGIGYIYPEDLSLKEFIEKFEPSWAQALVYYHPEYPYLTLCRTLTPSYNVDQDILAETSTFAGVLSSGVNLTNSGTTIATDPFFNSTSLTTMFTAINNMFGISHNDFKTSFTNAMDRYMVDPNNSSQWISIWEYAQITAHTPLKRSNRNYCTYRTQ